MSRTAIVLFNLGGPDALDAVEPFLFNLFNDRAIIALPALLRWPLAWLIARRRAPVARAIFAKMGGSSPLFANTLAQARALEATLGPDHRVFVAMRYWPPYASGAAAAVKAWSPDEIVLLPLYPQFSSTTTASSLRAWHDAAKAAGLDAPTRAVCCYPTDDDFIAALAERLETAIAEWPADVPLRILLSAHGLPERILAKGDPYRFQIEATAAALAARLGGAHDIVVCYQSRVGPLAWLKPATDAEIRRAGADGVGLVVLPIAFVSEHSETLVELDIEYGHLARAARVPRYVRLPTVSTDPSFIAALARLVRAARQRGTAIGAGAGERLCPRQFPLCPCGAAGGR
jgi:ferrochelatase